MHTIFIDALHEKKKLKVVFIALSDNQQRIRTCAPLDYGTLKKVNDMRSKYQFWDYCDGGSSNPHFVALLPEQILSIELTGELFEPGDFIHWSIRSNPWQVSRNWEQYS